MARKVNYMLVLGFGPLLAQCFGFLVGAIILFGY
jgi:hypothetical protein